MDTALNILIIEDSDRDVALEVRALKAAGYRVTYVVAENAAEMKAALLKQDFDIVISDHGLPQFDAPGALAVLKQSGLDIPFIVVSGTIGEETAVALMKAGAHDYVMKDRLSRLAPAVEQALTDAENLRVRKRADEMLKESERTYRLLADNIHDIIFVLDMNMNYTYVSPSIKLLSGYEPAEVLERIALETLMPSSRDLAIRTISEIMELEKSGHREIPISRTVQLEIMRKDWTTVWTEVKVSFIRDENQRPVGILGLARDITERKRAEDMIRSSEQRLSDIIEFFPDATLVIDNGGKVIAWNRAIETMTGIKAENMLGKGDYEYAIPFYGERRPIMVDLAIHPQPEIEKYYTKIRKTGNVLFSETYASCLPRGNTYLSATSSVLRNAKGEVVAAIECIRDITERKRAEDSLRKSERKYRLLADNINDAIVVLDMNLNYTYVSPSVKILRGYEPEEVMKQPTIESLTPSSWDLAMKTISEVMELEKSEQRDNSISRTLPLEMMRKDGTTVWTEMKFSFIRDEDQRPVGIMCVARDITERKLAEEALQQTLYCLNKAFGATIQVLVSAAEARDPYTAGHQLRSAKLACAIAVEMGLAEEQINGIRMAGSIHDIGKLSIPSEILTKPTKLTNIEFSLIKEHSEKGYEMVKDVESPWPLAQIIYQHHERMNGTGYPRNLKGDEILMEARIMAVADVVEAMASHRPYRPALGIEAALNEIEKNRGTLYDHDVADACQRLFREKGFNLEITDFK